ncbi:hypothetical protein BK666_22320 [Pseudomonas frederiksbergensis]|uniref:Uncharacterized protein n=1 Tax=Pseudomonas frederiksbergensis TaxID=104087 RepID=A0A423JYY7_9PSED|nr:hypothetical protein [Pseudomonas frederiksbergensis]RON42916.1 hypothetical protein BK666_22320 [Pseudomonas frederiksbergensis]
MSSNNVTRALIGGKLTATLRMEESHPGEREFVAKYEPFEDKRLVGTYLNAPEEYRLGVHAYQYVPDEEVQFFHDDIIFGFSKFLPIGRYELPHKDIKIIADYRFSDGYWQAEAGYLFLAGIDPSGFHGSFEAYKNENKKGPAMLVGAFNFEFAE